MIIGMRLFVLIFHLSHQCKLLYFNTVSYSGLRQNLILHKGHGTLSPALTGKARHYHCAGGGRIQKKEEKNHWKSSTCFSLILLEGAKSLTVWVIPHEGECVVRLCAQLPADQCEVKLNIPPPSLPPSPTPTLIVRLYSILELELFHSPFFSPPPFSSGFSLPHNFNHLIFYGITKKKRKKLEVCEFCEFFNSSHEQPSSYSGRTNEDSDESSLSLLSELLFSRACFVQLETEVCSGLAGHT